VVAGCSSEEPSAESEASPSPEASETVSAAPSPATPTTTERAVGEPATITLTRGQRRGEAAVAVTAVEKGTIKDLRDFVLDRRTRRSTPYYARLRVRNLSDTNLAGATVPLWGLDSTDTVLPPAEIRGTFGKCDGRPMPKKFTKGDRARTCLLFLAPRGARLEAVQFRPADQSVGPVSWPVR